MTKETEHLAAALRTTLREFYRVAMVADPRNPPHFHVFDDDTDLTKAIDALAVALVNSKRAP